MEAERKRDLKMLHATGFEDGGGNQEIQVISKC